MEAMAGGGGPLRAALDLQSRRVRRGAALRWMLLHALLFAVLGYDLWCACPGQHTLLHYVEAALAACSLAALAQHACCLLPAGAGPPRAVTSDQLRLLGLKPDDLDSSFHLSSDVSAPASPPSPIGKDVSELLSLSLSRSWSSSSSNRSPSPSHTSPPRPYSPHSPQSPSSPGRLLHSSLTDDRDEFIADKDSLTEYLKEYESRLGGAASARPAWLAPPPPPAYRRADLDHESAERAERAGERGGASWRLPLAPRRLAQYNLNLRLWLHATILARLERAAAAADAELARRALPDHALGQVSVEQLRALARECGSVRALLPYLAPFRDQRYLVGRLRQLSRGSCLSNYKWDGGEGAQPSDAEIILHLFATYLDGQVGGACGGACGAGQGGAGPGGACCAPFSHAHLWPPPGEEGKPPSPPGAVPPAPPALALQRVTRRPPHYVLVHGDHTIDVGPGRNNLLHSLLVFLALAAPPPHPADAAPPAAPSSALRRLQLGPAGINILWVIGR